MILRHYGDAAFDASLIRTFLPGIALSPHVTMFMMHRFGITIDEIREVREHPSMCLSLAEAKIWRPERMFDRLLLVTKWLMATTAHPVTNDGPRRVACDRVVALSRVVWDMVVAPGWLDEAPPTDPSTATNERLHVDVFSVAEAMFPLVALACRRVLEVPRTRKGNDPGSTYGVITLAARAPAPSCIAWISNHREQPTTNTRRQNSTIAIAVKEVAATLAGLCVGCHVQEARSLLGARDDCEGCGGRDDDGGAHRSTGTLPMLWDGRCVATTWKAADDGGCGDVGDCVEGGSRLVGGGGGGGGGGELRRRVIEYVRASCGSKYPIIDYVCESDDVELARWFFSVIGIGRKDVPWIRCNSLWPPVNRGKSKVVKWLLDEFHLEASLGPSILKELTEWCLRGNSPGDSRWFIEKKFPLPAQEKTIELLLRNEHASVEDCHFFEADIQSVGVDDYLLKDIHNPDVAKWVLTTLSLSPSQETLSYLCGNLGNVEFAQWLMTEKKFTPTPESFVLACSSSSSLGCHLSKLLSTRVTLTPSDITKGLINALLKSNIEVAEWLDVTFHVMDYINSKPGCPENTLTELLSGYIPSLAGLKWFVQHLPQPLSLKESSVGDAISHLISNQWSDAVVFLLDTFSQYQPQRNPIQFKPILVGLMRNDLRALQRVIQSVGVYSSLVLTPEFVGHCLTTDIPYEHPSSKIVKWVIRKFHLQYSHINGDDNALLFKLLSDGKNRCAQWLLETFDIPLDDVVRRLTEHSSTQIDLAGWQKILRHYGNAIDTTLIQSFLPNIVTSPHIAMFMMHRFGITIDEIRALYTDPDSMPEQTKLWLHSLL
ncbi:hypothetical protein Pelo_18163 [Pelomyxa schiedti]|nr:hypothetical protein Pelo_18163 [Pelomyxa schiedti]